MATTDNKVITGASIPALKTWVESKIADMGGVGDGSPVGTIIPYGGNSTPTGYLLCDGHSESKTTYPSLFEAIGYTYGGSGDSFNLPNLNGRFLEGSSEAGTIKEAGLPNIIGNLGQTVYASVSGSSGGAFPAGTNTGSSVANGGWATIQNRTFDASKSNTIYGKSNTVQPPSVTVRYIIKAYNSVTTESSEVEIEAQISGISERTALLESSAIVAHGGNDSTGYYLRYANGTQICWRTVHPTASFGAWGYAYSTAELACGAYPMPFVTSPTVSYGLSQSQSIYACIASATPSSSTQWGNVFAWRGTPISGSYTFDISAIAIGRWK